ncbi:MAG: CsbD family protein [Dehalococcoidia bacterium]|nr:CsbD family protein [Dehalococcoidia bacterium]
MTQAKGKARELGAKITGDRKAEARGKAEQMKGKGQAAMGKARDKMR